MKECAVQNKSLQTIRVC